MVEYYKDNPNVTVVLDRREGRIAAGAASTAASASCATGGATAPRGFPEVEPPAA